MDSRNVENVVVNTLPLNTPAHSPTKIPVHKTREYEELFNQLNETKFKLSNRTSQYLKVERDYGILSKKLINVEAERDILELKNIDLKDKIEDLSKVNQEVKVKNENLEKQNQDFKTEIEILQQQIKELQNKPKKKGKNIVPQVVPPRNDNANEPMPGPSNAIPSKSVPSSPNNSDSIYKYNGNPDSVPLKFEDFTNDYGKINRGIAVSLSKSENVCCICPIKRLVKGAKAYKVYTQSTGLEYHFEKNHALNPIHVCPYCGLNSGSNANNVKHIPKCKLGPVQVQDKTNEANANVNVNANANEADNGNGENAEGEKNDDDTLVANNVDNSAEDSDSDDDENNVTIVENEPMSSTPNH